MCDVLGELMEKKELVQWNNGDRKEKFLLISKSGFTKICIDRMKKEGVLYWDIRDFNF